MPVEPKELVPLLIGKGAPDAELLEIDFPVDAVCGTVGPVVVESALREKLREAELLIVELAVTEKVREAEPKVPVPVPLADVYEHELKVMV